MIGEDITIDDLSPNILNIDGVIPEIPQFKERKSRDLESLPVRVKTRYQGGRAGRRVVSAPTFDLVTSYSQAVKDDLSFFKQPRMSHYEIGDFARHVRNPESMRPRSLPCLPEGVPQNHTSKRLVSMPVQTAKTHDTTDSVSSSSYINIIQIYSESSPNGLNYDMNQPLNVSRGQKVLDAAELPVIAGIIDSLPETASTLSCDSVNSSISSSSSESSLFSRNRSTTDSLSPASTNEDHSISYEVPRSEGKPTIQMRNLKATRVSSQPILPAMSEKFSQPTRRTKRIVP
jgi:hypothetical protein